MLRATGGAEPEPLAELVVIRASGRYVALLEARRVLRPQGVLALATWGSIELSPLYARMAEIVEWLAGPEAAAIVRAPFELPDPSDLERMLSKAGFETIEIRSTTEAATDASVDAFLEGEIVREIGGPSLGAVLQAKGTGLYDRVTAAVRQKTETVATSTGVVFPMTANLISARVR